MQAWASQSTPHRVGIRSLERTPRQQAGQASQLLAVAAKAVHSLLAAHHLCACLGLHSVSRLLLSLEATPGRSNGGSVSHCCGQACIHARKQARQAWPQE